VLELEADGARTDAQQHRTVRWIARVLRAATRTSDFVARTGDDQFMALLPNSSESQARSIMARVEGALARRLQDRPVGHAPRVVRVAVVTAPRDGSTVDALFASAAHAVAMRAAPAQKHRAG
jgi:GGDEF domain-containing protein